MASFWSDYLKNKVLDHYRGITTFTPPATTYFALMTVRPTPAGGGTQVATLSRLSVTNNLTQWNTASASQTTNKNDLLFTASAPSDLGTVVGIAEYDAATAGNLLTYGDLAAEKVLSTGTQFKVAANQGIFTYVDDVPLAV